MSVIYLDNNATTPLDQRVIDVMLPILRDQYANPSSVHVAGQQARHLVESAREVVAGAIGARPRQIVFTGGGTEANNLAIRGRLASVPDLRHFVTTAVEHESVLRMADQLEREGYRVTRVGVDGRGHLDLDAFEAALTEDTGLASVMHANNETGVVFPIERVGELTSARDIPLHVDATQTVGKLPIDVSVLPVDILTMAAHKFHGPKGVGAIYLRRGVRVQPQMLGGHQERDLRAGTENVAGIVGMAEALRLAVEHLDEENTRVRSLRDRLENGIIERASIARVLGDRACRLPNTTNIGFEQLSAEGILMVLSGEGICASSGSACSSGSIDPSHVLQAMGIEPAVAHGAIRFSLSRFNTDADIDRALEIIPAAIDRLAKLQPSANAR